MKRRVKAKWRERSAGFGLAGLLFSGLFIAPSLHAIAHTCCEASESGTQREAPSTQHESDSCDVCLFSAFGHLQLPPSEALALQGSDAAVLQALDIGRRSSSAHLSFEARAPPLLPFIPLPV